MNEQKATNAEANAAKKVEGKTKPRANRSDKADARSKGGLTKAGEILDCARRLQTALRCGDEEAFIEENLLLDCLIAKLPEARGEFPI